MGPVIHQSASSTELERTKIKAAILVSAWLGGEILDGIRFVARSLFNSGNRIFVQLRLRTISRGRNKRDHETGWTFLLVSLAS
jgi:hypothetical protein